MYFLCRLFWGRYPIRRPFSHPGGGFPPLPANPGGQTLLPLTPRLYWRRSSLILWTPTQPSRGDGNRLRAVTSSITRQRGGPISAIGCLLSMRLGFNDHNPRRREPSPQNHPRLPRQRLSSTPIDSINQGNALNPMNSYCSSPCRATRIRLHIPITAWLGLQIPSLRVSRRDPSIHTEKCV